MAGSLTPGSAAMTIVPESAPPGLAEPAQPAASSRASPDTAASEQRIRKPRRPGFSSGTPAGSSLMTLLARSGIYRHSSGHRGCEPESFLNTGVGAESTLLLPGGPSNITLQWFFRFVCVLTHLTRLTARVAVAVTAPK